MANIRNFERIGERKFNSWESAKSFQANQLVGAAKQFDKSKIFRRFDGTFDVVWYKKISEESAPEKKKVTKNK